MWPFADLYAVRRVRLGGARRLRRRLPDRAGLRGLGTRAPVSGCARAATVAGLLLDGDKVTGVRLADGSEISAGTVVVATGVWTKPFLEPYGDRRPDPGGARADRDDRPRRRDRPACQCSPTWSRCSTSARKLGGDILFGNSDLSDVEEADPDNYLNRADRRLRRPHRRQGRHPVPRLHRRGDQQQLRRVLRRHARLEPGDLAGPPSTASSWPPASAGTASRSRRPSAGSSPTSSSTAAAPTRASRRSDFRLSRFAEGDLLKTPVSVCRRRADAMIPGRKQ